MRESRKDYNRHLEAMKTSQLGEGELPEVRARDQLTCTAAIPLPKKNTNVLLHPF